MTARQEAWTRAAREGGPAAPLFALVAQPNEAERGGHLCFAYDVQGFSRDGRRGLKCMICGDVKRWLR